MSPTAQGVSLKRRRTKIVATLGPASRDPETIRALLEAGAEVFRLNFSHGSHEEHGETFRRVREVARDLRAPAAILGDLCGPKIRVGRFPGGSVSLERGSEVTVSTRSAEAGDGWIPSAYEALASDVKPEDRILLDDGRLELRVQSVDGGDVRCLVVRGGTLRDRKGMNLPGVSVSAPSLTEQDRRDAAFAVELGVDFLALSFVRRPEDVKELRKEIPGSGEDGPAIIAKIEKPEALEAIEPILEASDGIMVARGDLGVELPPEDVPLAQRDLVERARRAGKPAIVATQMLESMVEHSRPTRAEVSDVAGAVASGADAVMLSAETAAGSHPVEAVRVMDRVARKLEGYLWQEGGFGGLSRGTPGVSLLPVEDAVAGATAQLSRDLMVRAIVVRDDDPTGESVRRVSAGRPQAPVLFPSSDAGRVRRSALLWGVVPAHLEEGDRPGQDTRSLARDLDLASPGDHVLEVEGFHTDPEMTAPSIRILRV